MWEILYDGERDKFILKYDGKYYTLRATNYVGAKLEVENYFAELA